MTHKEAPATEKRQKLARLSPDELNELWQALFGSDALKLIETDKILGPALEQIRSESLARFERHGDIGRWWRQIAALTPETQSPRDLRAECPSAEVTHLGHTEEVLRALTAWKKGPFRFTQGPAELRLDAEWHCQHPWRTIKVCRPWKPAPGRKRDRWRIDDRNMPETVSWGNDHDRPHR